MKLTRRKRIKRFVLREEMRQRINIMLLFSVLTFPAPVGMAKYATDMPHFLYKPIETATIKDVYNTLRWYGLTHAEIVTSQCVLETGYLRSRVCREDNNLFGLRQRGHYMRFARWQDSVIAYRDKIQKRHRKGENYYTFLRRIGYAQDKAYTDKVKRVVKRMEHL